MQRLREARGRLRAAAWGLLRPPRGADYLAPYQLCYRSVRPLRDLPRRFEDPRFDGVFDLWGGMERLEYLYRYPKKAVIDPACGFIIAEGAGPLLPSLMESDFSAIPSRAAQIERLPSPVRYFYEKSLGRGNFIRLPAAVSLRALSEAGYWHFYHDVLSKLRLLEEQGIGEEIPLVVSRTLYDTPYFQEAIRRRGLAGRQFLPQDQKTYVIADEVVFGTTMGHDKRNFEYLRRLLGAPEPDLKSARRFYLLRGKGRPRRIVNDDQVQEVTRRYGFEPVDTDGMTLADQMALFGSARYVVGIHGAGLVNLIYRAGAPLGLIELFTPRHVAPHYYWLATDYGHEYDALLGTETPESAPDRSFVIDPEHLARKIKAMLGEER